MKKVIMMTLVLMAQVMLWAQDREIEIMTSRYVEGDEMLGTPGSLKWRSEHVAFTEWPYGIGMGLLNPPHVFVVGKGRMDPQFRMNTARVGIYSNDGTLVWLAEDWTIIVSEDGQMVTFSQDSKARSPRTGEKRKLTPADVLSMLKTGEYYVRLIAKMYGGYLFDVSATTGE